MVTGGVSWRVEGSSDVTSVAHTRKPGKRVHCVGWRRSMGSRV